MHRLDLSLYSHPKEAFCFVLFVSLFCCFVCFGVVVVFVLFFGVVFLFLFLFFFLGGGGGGEVEWTQSPCLLQGKQASLAHY